MLKWNNKKRKNKNSTVKSVSNAMRSSVNISSGILIPKTVQGYYILPGTWIRSSFLYSVPQDFT